MANTEEKVDHLVNLLSKLGGSADASQQDRIFEPDPLDQGQLTTLYRHNHYAAKIVDERAESAMQHGWSTVGDGINEDDFDEHYKRLNVKESFLKADKWAHLYGGAVVILGTQDPDRSSEPLDLDKVRDVKFLMVKHRYQVAKGPIELDTSSEWVGRPRWYKVRKWGLPDDIGADVRVHPSRVIEFPGVELPEDVEDVNDGWGDSRLQRSWNAISNLWQGENAAANAVHHFSKNVWKIKGLANAIKANGEDALKDLQERITAMNLAEGQLGAWLLDADKDEYEKRTTNVAGLPDLIDRLIRALASAADMPITRLFGTPPAGLSTDDEAGKRNWNDQIRGRLESVIVPGLEYFLLVLAHSRNGPTGGKVPDGLGVSANPLEELSEEQKANIYLTRTKADATNVDRGILERDEIRENRYVGGDQDLTGIAVDSRDTPPDETGEAPELPAPEPPEGEPDPLEGDGGDGPQDDGPEGPDNTDAVRGDPYSGPDDDTLPTDVLELPPNVRREFVETFNRWFDRLEDEPPDNREAIAFGKAYTAIQELRTPAAE